MIWTLIAGILVAGAAVTALRLRGPGTSSAEPGATDPAAVERQVYEQLYGNGEP